MQFLKVSEYDQEMPQSHTHGTIRKRHRTIAATRFQVHFCFIQYAFHTMHSILCIPIRLELPRPIPWNQTSNVHQGTTMYFDNVMLTLHNVILTSQKPCQHNNKCNCSKVSKGAKIRNRYNQVPHLTQDTNGKVTNSQLDSTN